MKKKLAIIVVALLMLLTFVACQSDEDKYKDQVKALTAISSKELNKMIEDKKSFNLYLGRENCPYCRILAPQLSKLAKDDKVEIYYLDTLETDADMDKFFEQYKLEYVPSLMVFKAGKGQEIALDHNKAKEDGNYDIEKIKSQFK